MDLGRLRRGEWLAGTAAVALLVVMFVDWYALDLEAVREKTGVPISTGISVSAWEAFAIVDLFLALAACSALVLVFLTATQRSSALPVAAGVVTSTLSILALLLLAYRLLDEPTLEAATAAYATTLEAGAWLGLLATVALLAGAWWSMRDESPSASADS